MLKQDHLVALIGALSTNEKRYFKLFSSLQSGDKRYLRLFDALEVKKEYNPKELSSETGLSVKQLTDDKYYLTQILLQSLQNFDNQGTSYHQLITTKENIRSLMQRRQFAFALDLLDKAEEQAWQLEAFEMIEDMLFMRNRCIFAVERYTDEFDLNDQHRKCRLMLDELFTLLALGNTARKYHAEARQQAEYKKLLDHKLLKSVRALHSHRARLLYYEIWAGYFIVTFNNTELARIQQEAQQLFEKHPVVKIINPVAYVTNTLRFSTTKTAIGENKSAYEMLERVGNELQQASLEISAQQLQSLKISVESFKLWPLRHLKQYSQAIKICRAIYPAVAKRNEADKFTVLFEFAMSLFFNNEIDEAIDRVDELLRIKSDIRSDIQPYVRILAIMIQLQVNNYALVPHLVKATRLWFKKHQVASDEFNLFFKHALLIANSASPITAWRNFKKAAQEGNLSSMSKLIHVDLWINNKIAGTT